MDDRSAAPRVRRGLATLLTLLSLIALVLFARAALLSFEPALAPGREALLWLSLLPVLLGLGVLYGLSGKMLFTAWSGYWLLWALFLANTEKLEHLSRSLRPGDFSALPTFLSSPSLFVHYLDTNSGGLWWIAGGVALWLALLLLEPRSLRAHWSLRLAFALLCGAALVSLFGSDRWTARFSAVYDDNFYLWAPEAGMQHHGLIAGLLKLSWAAQVGQARPDPAAVERFIADNAAAIAQRAARAVPAVPADLVIVQAESLFDPADLRGVEPGGHLGQFHRLARRGLSGRLKVPTFAGGTIRTEFEILTGYPLDAFPEVEYPYLGLALRTPSSLAHVLARFGYEASVVHPFQREFWNREDAMRALGFDNMHFYEAFQSAPTHGWYTTDAALFEHVLGMLSDEGPPQLVFAITMENHGPWNRDRELPHEELAAQAEPPGLSEAGKVQWRNYSALLDSGDRALAPFAEALLARKRPTLLFVYGDHLPDLGAVYDDLGFDNGAPPWVQTVPYMLIGNVGYPEAQLDSESEFLGALLLDALKLPFEGYLSLNAVARDSLSFAPLDDADRTYVRAMLRNAAQLDYVDGGIDTGTAASKAGSTPAPP